VDEPRQDERSARNALLTRTLEESPRLQAQVRSLHLNTWTINDRERLEWLSLRILRCCPLVQRLCIRGWIPSLLDEFHTTIATFTGLRYLYIRSFIGCMDPFCSFERLEAMMKGWPNLEHLEIRGRVVTGDGGDSIRGTQHPPMNKHFTRLTVFRLSCFGLGHFTHLTPNLVELSLGMVGDPLPVLLHAQKWKHTLRRLKVKVISRITYTQVAGGNDGPLWV